MDLPTTIRALGFLILLSSHPAWASSDPASCIKQALATTPDPVQKAESVLERALTRSQKKALWDASAIGDRDAYTAGEIQNQESLLKKRDFSQQDIDLLRAKGVLGNWKIEWPEAIPSKLTFIDTKTGSLDSSSLLKIRDGQSVRYLINSEGSIRIAPLESTGAVGSVPSSETLWVARTDSDAFLVEESGTLSFDPKSKQFVFKPDYSLPLSNGESDQIVTTAERATGVKFQHPDPNTPAREFNCLNAFEGEVRGKGFIQSRMIGANAIWLIGVGTSEAMGAKRLQSKEGQTILLDDLFGVNVGAFSSAITGRIIVSRSNSLISSYASRTALILGAAGAKKALYVVTDHDKDAAHVSNGILIDDVAMAIPNAAASDFADRLIMNTLPSILYDKCLQNSATRFLISPNMIRIVEGAATSIIYYGIRSVYPGK